MSLEKASDQANLGFSSDSLGRPRGTLGLTPLEGDTLSCQSD